MKQDGDPDGGSDLEDASDETYEAQEAVSSRKGVPVTLDELLDRRENILITGDREIGKTSLAHFIAVKVSDGECDKPRIPLIIDFRNFGANLYSLKRQAAAYLGVHATGLDIEDALAKGNAIIIVDNFSGQNSVAKVGLQKLVASYPDARWVLLADTRMGGTNRSVENNDLIDDCLIAKIDTLPRRSIRELTRRWCERTGADTEKIFSTVMGHINSSDLPRTGYIVTLLLWAIRQGEKLERINESVLIMNMVDYLLGKANFEKALEKEFDATSKEITLQSFARFIRDHGGIVSSNNAIAFLIDFFKDRGLDYDASGVLDALCRCGIVVKKQGEVSFKYRCFQEYFIARFLNSSEARLKEALLNRSYLGFQREIELLAGLNRENKVILDELSFQLKSYQPSYIADVDMKDFDDVVNEESSVGVTRRKLRQIREKKLTADQIDDLMDAAEAEIAQRKKPNGERSSKPTGSSEVERPSSEGSASEIADPLPKTGPDSFLSQPKLSVGSYMATLSLLGKVIRASEFAERDFKIALVRLYVSLASKLFVYVNGVVSSLFESLVESMNEDSEFLDAESARALKYYLTKRMMFFSGGIISSDIGGTKLIPVFEDILHANDLSLAEKTFLSGIQLDIGNENWVEHWGHLARESKKRRIAVEFLVDKLWAHIHEKVLTVSERRDVERMAADLEIALGAHKKTKSQIMQHMRAVTEKQARDKERDE